MRSWELSEIEIRGGTRSPVVLHSDDEARAVLICLEPGQRLGDHQVKERAWLSVVEGSVRIESDGRTIDAEPGMLVRFDSDERRSLSSEDGARLLLLFAPWPGAGHYRSEEKAAASS